MNKGGAVLPYQLLIFYLEDTAMTTIGRVMIGWRLFVVGTL